MTTTENRTETKLADLVAELEAATDRHAAAERAESAARSQMCEAMNRLNAAQKALDAHMRKLKEKAPWNSDWKRTDGKVALGN